MMKIMLILLLLAVFGVLIGSHIFVQRSLLRAFNFEQLGLRWVILALTICLSLSFPLSMLLVKNWSNLFTENLFIFAAWWMALFINLFMAVAVGRLLCFLAGKAGHELTPKWVLLGAVLLAFLFTAYGVWRAGHPQVHRVKVEIQGLPEVWQGVSIVQLSDIHLGYLRGAAFMQRIAHTVNDLKPVAVLITGDLFDGIGGDFASFRDSMNLLDSKYGTFMATGNHEVYADANEVLDRADLHVLDGDVVELEGVQIVGISYPGLSGEKALLRLKKDLSTEIPSILLYHTPTDIMQRGEGQVDQHFSTYWRPDTSCALNRELGIDLQLSGHTHAGQIFPFGLVSNLIYRGRDRGLHRDGDFHLYVSGGTGTFGPPIRTAGRSEIVLITLISGQ